jgi:hypothetical protein
VTTRRRIAWVLGVFSAAAIVSAALDSAASGHLRRFDDRRLMNVTLERERATTYRRPIIVGTPLSQNAVTEYRPVFANLEMLPKDTSKQLGALVNQGISVDLAIAGSFLAAECGEVQSPRFRAALRCTRCDWQLGSASDPVGVEALFLGNCLVLAGHSSGGVRDWRRSAQSYTEALSFACDLGQGNLWTNLMGITVATSALRGLTQLVESAGDDPTFLQRVSGLLSDISDRLPSVNTGIRALHAELAGRLAADARSYARSFDRFGVVVPGRAFAVWRLRRHESFLEKLEQAAGGGDVEQRVELARQVRTYAADSGSEAFKSVPTIVPEAILTAESVRLQFGSLRAAIAVHEWRMQHGSFPTDGARLPVFSGEASFRYEPIESGKGYRIVVNRGSRAGEVLIAHQPGRRTKN